MKILVGIFLLLRIAYAAAEPGSAHFEVSYSAPGISAPVTGRLFIVIAKKDSPEPRLLISPQGPALFGRDVEQWRAGETMTLDAAHSIGFPKPLAELPPGDYFAQALINIYSEAHRSDGHNIWLHFPDSGALDTFNAAPGNLYSDVQPIHIGGGEPIKIAVNRVIPPHTPPTDTEWIKHVRIQSQKLTRFWGRPIYIDATVLLPKGYAEHPTVHYPTVFPMIHSVPFQFNTTPASDRQRQAAKATGLETGYDFYQSWNSDSFPRFLAISFQQPTPFFPDSYSVNSVNQGPYGDALVEEIIPALEKQFRMIPKPYARQLEGASTGGWQTLALQLHYPEFFGAAWVLQPDPIDFRNYQLVNIYEDENAFSVPLGPFTSAERPFKRAVNGQVVWTLREMSLFEETLGSKVRSGYQLEGWEAIYGPIGADGYPVPLWDKLTGKINHDVANYMRDHGYDLRAYAEKNWSTIGPKLTGKLHFFCGDMDDFYLNLAMYSFQDFLKSTQSPHYESDFTFGRPMKGHSWHAMTWADYVRKMAEQVQQNAPAGEDTNQWRYGAAGKAK
jgi:hypothetical protein